MPLPPQSLHVLLCRWCSQSTRWRLPRDVPDFAFLFFGLGASFAFFFLCLCAARAASAAAVCASAAGSAAFFPVFFLGFGVAAGPAAFFSFFFLGFGATAAGTEVCCLEEKRCTSWAHPSATDSSAASCSITWGAKFGRI